MTLKWQWIGLTLCLGFLGCFPGQSEKERDEVSKQAKPTSKEVKAPGNRSWPMFGGSPQRNMVNLVEKDLPVEWSVKEGERKNVKWVVDLGNVAYGGPVIAGGKVFVGTNNEQPRNPKVKGDKGVVMCFQEADGAFLWQALHDKLAGGQDVDFPQQGIASTPAVDGNRVYYVSNRCELVCADVEGFRDGKNDGIQDETLTGKEDADIVWRLDMIEKFKVYPHQLAACSPLVVGDLVFLLTGNGVEGKTFKVAEPKAPSFLAVDKKTGEVVWQDNSPGEEIMEGQWANPAFAEVNGKQQVIFPGGDGWLRAFEARTGKLIWKFNGNPKSAVFKPGGRGTRNYFVSTPVVYDNKVFVGMGQNPENGLGVGHLWCIDITKSGDLSPRDGNFDPKAEGNKESGLVWHYGGLIMPKPKEEDREDVFGRTISTCAIHDGLLYIAELKGFVHCLDAKTGEKYWVHDLKADIWGSPFWVDGKIYLGNGDGVMTIFAPGKQCKILATVDMDDGPIKSTVVAANGVLYIQTGSHLFAIAKN